jgi:ABC-type molybdate transport system substrate-binding protein
MTRPSTEIRLRDYPCFAGTVMIAHVLTYVIVGTLAYAFIYESAIAEGGFDAFMRSPNNPEEWAHVET